MRSGAWKLQAFIVLMSLSLCCAAANVTHLARAHYSTRRAPQTSHARRRAPPRHRPLIYLTPQIGEVLRLSKSGVSDDVVIAYIEHSPWNYHLTADQLISLKHAGIKPDVLKALAEHGPVSPEPLPAWARGRVTPPPMPGGYAGLRPAYARVSWNAFSSALGALGQWCYVPGYGWCWQPGPAAFASAANGLSSGNLVESSPLCYSGFWPGFGFGGGGQGEHRRDHHRTGHGSPVPWLAMNEPAQPGGANLPGMAYLPVGVLPPANNGNYPFLPLGGQPASGNAPPYGIPGVPLVPNNGANPYLPVGGRPVSGAAPPYGIPGVPMVPNNGANPYLPIGGQPAAGNLNPYGVISAFGGRTPENFGQPGFPALPASPVLPASPMLPGGPFFFGPHAARLYPGGSWPSWPSWPTLPHFGRGFHGGGFHGVGGFHGAGGGHH
jgi:hypothetical protein